VCPGEYLYNQLTQFLFLSELSNPEDQSMRRSHLCRLLGFALALTLVVGCGSDSGPAKPAADMDELQQYLADNPDQNTDDVTEEMEEDDLTQ
jgi:hypothetical protein